MEFKFRNFADNGGKEQKYSWQVDRKRNTMDVIRNQKCCLKKDPAMVRALFYLWISDVHGFICLAVYINIRIIHANLWITQVYYEW